MSNTDFGSAFSDTPPSPSSEAEPLRITLDDVNQAEAARSTAIEPVGPMKIEMISPQRLASERYGVLLSAPERGEDLFVGVARNPDKRTEEEEYFPIFSSYPRRRQHQIFTFEVEVPDEEGNPIEHVPVEVRGQEISGVLPSDGTPVAVYGSRDRSDGVVRTYKVINLRTRSSIRVTVRPKDWCFVATAVYGSVDAPQVAMLRRFRDRYLMSNSLGQWCVRIYYCCSPPLAGWVAGSSRRRWAACAILDGLITVLHRTLFLGLMQSGESLSATDGTHKPQGNYDAIV